MTDEEKLEADEAAFENDVDRGNLDDEYSEYLCNHSNAMIGNGDQLIRAIEGGHYYESFKEWYLNGGMKK